MAAPLTISDEILITQARTGDQEAFRQLVMRYEGQVARTVTGMLGQSQDAEDVGQEVFIRFYRSIQDFKGDSQLGTYLTRIAINLSINAIKRKQRKNLLSLFTSDGMMMDKEDNNITQDQRDTQQWVRIGLQRLPADFRAVIVLRLIEGYSTQETAEALQIPVGTVLSRLARAQKKLRQILEEIQ